MHTQYVAMKTVGCISPYIPCIVSWSYNPNLYI